MTFAKQLAPKKDEEENEDYYDNLPTDYPNNDFIPSIDSETKLNDKLISSANTGKKIIIQTPIFEYHDFLIPVRTKENKPLIQNGYYVAKAYKRKQLCLMGVKEKEYDFPIEDAFNDSRTSSFLTEEEKRLLFKMDDIAFSLWKEQFSNPMVEHNLTINKLYWNISSITDNSKGFGGAAAEMAKKNISISESSVKDYREMNRILDEQQKAKKGGLLGGHVIPGII